MTNPRVFFDITIDGQPKGRIAFELFHDVVPKTADNFLHLCLGDKGSTKSGVPLSYKGSGESFRLGVGNVTEERRSVPSMYQEVSFPPGVGSLADVLKGSCSKVETLQRKFDLVSLAIYLTRNTNSGNGTGGESIYGEKFEGVPLLHTFPRFASDVVWVDENFTLKHDKPFLLSMANAGTPPFPAAYIRTPKIANRSPSRPRYKRLPILHHHRPYPTPRRQTRCLWARHRW
jgi:peptidyl-prolyl isomerase D